MTKITTKVGKGDDASAPVTINYEFGTTVADLVKKFGEPIVLAHVLSSFTIALQGTIRAKMKKYLDAKPAQPVNVPAIQKELAEWKPGLRVPGKSKAEKIKDDYKQMSPEERKELMKDLAAAV